MVRITNQYIWNVVFIVFFLSLLVMGSIILDTEAYKPYESLGTFDFILISLASFRMIRLFVFDSMTKFFREQFYDTKVTKTGKVTLHKATKGPRRTLSDFLTCPWCFGLWSTATVTFFYLLTPFAYFPILILAVAGVATFLQIIASFLQSKSF